ncbi:hypothetical protein BOX37_13935 [Nocardia mangyaensis]|uniref:Uncharacterized protein n=1 Tax=Nocardia mangyaensis TaxID=2213200 RepID=A0A1J0VS49_9NOCA|nr:hypothetical protein [Nocardia mangyaensis]APE34867.1 hypothetical protein BOX37_13935 [Nocardia mangyaensis]
MSTFQQRRVQRARRAGLIGSAGFVAFWAFAGAIGLIGGGIDLGPEITARLPLESQVLAGLLLAAIVGVPMTYTAILALRALPSAAVTGIGSGLLLLGWVAIQPLVIGQFNWLQPVFGVLGGSVCLLGSSLCRSSDGFRSPKFPFRPSPA